MLKAGVALAEHIGSKTAVQVRSHAQKFFSKLEKQEAAGIKSEGVRWPPMRNVSSQPQVSCQFGTIPRQIQSTDALCAYLYLT